MQSEIDLNIQGDEKNAAFNVTYSLILKGFSHNICLIMIQSSLQEFKPNKSLIDLLKCSTKHKN